MDPFLVAIREHKVSTATSLLCNSWRSEWMPSCVLLITAVLEYARDNTGVTENEMFYMIDEILANFLFCDQYIIRERSLTFESCVNSTGFSFGVCHSAYPGFNNTDFQECFDLIHNSPLLNTPEMVDILSFISKTCQQFNNTETLDICRSTQDVLYAVFDIKERYDATLNPIFAYIYPSTLAVSGFLNLLLVLVLVRKFTLTTYFILLGVQCILEFVFCIMVLPVLLMVFTFDLFSSDYMDASLIRVLSICSSVIPGMMHGMSVMLTIGLLLQRYIIVAYPFKIKVYDKRRYVIIFIILSFAWCLAFYLPDIYETSNLQTIQIVSKLDAQVTIETIIMHRSVELERINLVALCGRMIFVYFLPDLFTMIFVVKFFRLLRKRRKVQLTLRGKIPAADAYQFLSRMTMLIVTTFLVIEIPNCIGLFLVILINLRVSTVIEFNVKMLAVAVQNLSAITYIIKSAICLFSTTTTRTHQGQSNSETSRNGYIFQRLKLFSIFKRWRKTDNSNTEGSGEQDVKY